MSNANNFDKLNGAFKRVIESKAKMNVEVYKESKTFNEFATKNEKELLQKYCELYSYKPERELLEMLKEESKEILIYTSARSLEAHRAVEIKDRASEIDHWAKNGIQPDLSLFLSKKIQER